MKSYTLVNVIERHKQYPRTFMIPSKQEIEALQLGQLVKLIFQLSKPMENGFQAERMWVEITEITQDGFVGVLDNMPCCLQDLHPGDIICFRAEHVASIYMQGMENYFDESKFALITCRALEQREINWLMRTDDLCDPQDSGWSLFYGDEDDAYLEDPDHAKVISLEEAMSFEPRLEAAFSGDGIAYQYDADENTFIEMQNFE